MKRTINIGCQNFEQLRVNNYFYIDKTKFIKEWWENGDTVTLITRPRRFGKTLTMDMVEKFFSVSYADRKELFQGLSIWEEEKYRKLQGSYPVIFLSFAGMRGTSFAETRKQIGQSIVELYNKYDFLLDSSFLNEREKEQFQKISSEMEAYRAVSSLKNLSDYLFRYYGKKVILLLDEYDTPMQQAYLNTYFGGCGYWEEITGFIRNLFQETFKTNPYLERGILTGVTRISKESLFSGLNNLEVVSTTSEKYKSCFGFQEEEVFTALEEYGLDDEKQNVKLWYDGFIFGGQRDIYNPWSIINYLEKGRISTYWANTSSNDLAGKLIQEGSASIKQSFETLLSGGTLTTGIDEQVVFEQLDQDEAAIWSLLLASGYLKVIRYEEPYWNPEEMEVKEAVYELMLTNLEVRLMFRTIVSGWFRGKAAHGYQTFLKALLLDDVEVMNQYINEVALASFSSFDTGKQSSENSEPERFYHGFVLGLMVDLSDRYILTSNRESGFGRYDIMLEPKPAVAEKEDAIIIEFKVRNPRKEKTLGDTVTTALKQIEEKKYVTSLIAKGIPEEQIRKYGFAFEGKNVLIGTDRDIMESC